MVLPTRLTWYCQASFIALVSIIGIILDVLVVVPHIQTSDLRFTDLSLDDVWLFTCDDAEKTNTQLINPVESSSFSNESLSEASFLKNETLQFINEFKKSSTWTCFSFKKWTKLTPAVFSFIVLSGYYLINLVVSGKAIQPDVKSAKSTSNKIELIFGHILMYLPGFIMSILLICGIVPLRFFWTLFLSCPGMGLLAGLAHLRRCQENVAEKIKNLQQTASLNPSEHHCEDTVNTKSGSMAFRLIISEIYLFQSAILSTFSLAFKMNMNKTGAHTNQEGNDDFIRTERSVELFQNSSLNISVLWISVLVNVFQIVHAWKVYYRIRYVKYQKDCKKDILYTAVDNDIDIKLTFFQKFITLPLAVITTVMDHFADISLIVFYFSIGVQEKNRSGDWQILNWGIISLSIWVISNVAQMRIQNKRLKDVHQEDPELKMVRISTVGAPGKSDIQIKKTLWNHLSSFVLGPIINVWNLYRTVPSKGLITYKFAILKQLNTMAIILEDTPQFLVHLYVLYVISGYAEENSVKSIESGLVSHNYTQITKSFDEENFNLNFININYVVISAKNMVIVRLLLSIKAFVVDFSSYKRMTLELQGVKKEGEKKSLWKSRNYSRLMMSTAEWTDTIAQLLFFSARALVCIWATTHLSKSDGRGLWIDYAILGVLKTLIFGWIYNGQMLTQFNNLCNSLVGTTVNDYTKYTLKAKKYSSKKYTLVPDYNYDDEERQIDGWLPLLSYFTYNLGSNFLVTLLNYLLTIIEFSWFHSRCSDYFKFDPISLLAVSFLFASQTFLLYKLAVVFDDECGDKLLRQEGIDDDVDGEVSKVQESEPCLSESKSAGTLIRDIKNGLKSNESE